MEQVTGAEAPIEVTDAGLVFRNYVERDQRAVDAARRWQAERRRTGQDDGLGPWASLVLSLGAQVAALGEASGGVAGLASTVSGLAARAESAGAALADRVSREAREASEAAVTATKAATEQTAAALAEARKQAAADLAAAARTARETVTAELGRLLGGADSTAARGVAEIVRQQMAEVDARLALSFNAALDRAAASWDGDNPTSAVAALERRLADRHDRASARLLSDLERVREGVASVAAAAQAQAAVTAVAASTTLKGKPFEDRAGAVLEGAAATLGGTYAATGDLTGAVKRSKKGDGIFEVPAADGGRPVRVVVEMTTTGAARRWGPYLDEAMRNREADAAIGIVPSCELVPGAQPLAVVGPRRIVVALEDSAEGVAIVQAAALLVALQVQRDAALEGGAAAAAEADRRLAEAQAQLALLAETLKAAQAVRTGAGKVVSGLEAVHEALVRSLLQARAALAAGGSVGDDEAGAAA